MSNRTRSRGSKQVRASEPEQLPLFAERTHRRRRAGRKRRPGRKPKGPRAGSPHRTRPELRARHPVHVVLRVVPAVGNLRRRSTYKAVREATLTTAVRDDFRIVHLSIQRNHLHLLVEADHKGALASGMQGFQISAAKHLNAAISKGRPGPRRRGSVFPDRYHAEIITTPTQARHALNYVIINRSVVPRATAHVSSEGSRALHRAAVARCASARRVWIGATRGVYATSETDPRGFVLVPARTQLLVSALATDTWLRAERGPHHTLC